MDKLLKPLHKIGEFVRRYVVLLCFIIFGAMYGYLIYTSGQQAAQEPSEAQVTEKFQAAKRPKLDEATAETLRQLSDQNVEVQALFNEARQNPFAE